MIRIRFADSESERRGLGFLAGRFSFKSRANGETVVPEAALAALAVKGIPFSVQGLSLRANRHLDDYLSG